MLDEGITERIDAAAAVYVTTEEICALFHVSRRTVYRWKAAGKLHPVKAGQRNLFIRKEVEAMAKEAGNAI